MIKGPIAWFWPMQKDGVRVNHDKPGNDRFEVVYRQIDGKLVVANSSISLRRVPF